jgi:hypothetical protein
LVIFLKAHYRVLFLLSFIYLGLIFSQPHFNTIVYDSSDGIFPNPERGFSAYRDFPLSASFCQQLRSQAVSVVQRIYTVPQYVNDSLASSFLNLIQNDFNVARENGVKFVLRFSYTNDINGSDAPLDTILRHIDQLEPLLSQNYDVIANMEAGFIGAWGEWYYSSNGLNNTRDRRTVLYKLLDALPSDRMVCIRTPDYKRKIFNYSDPLTPEEAFSGTRRARTGAHNDAFLANWSDYGTYLDTLVDKTYLNLDNRFVPQGGETCEPSSFSGCSNALKELKRMRWSVLNKDYHPAVLQDWITNGCMDEIKRRLGYRFRLMEATIQDSARPAAVFQFSCSVINDGWASPYNPRNLELILREIQNGQIYYLLTEEDPRFWMAGDTSNITVLAGIPNNMPVGEYEVLLHFADPLPSLHDKSEFSIRLANVGIWESSTGYNALLDTLTIDPNASGPSYNGELYFQPKTMTGIEDINKHGFNEIFHLQGNYPNPFNNQTVIKFSLSRSAHVEVEIFNINGQQIAQLFYGRLSAGEYEVPWEPRRISSGLYIYKLTVNGLSKSKQLIYLK